MTRITGFDVDKSGDVFLHIDLGAGPHSVRLSAAMLTAINEAQAKVTETEPLAEWERDLLGRSAPTYYFQVESPDNKTLLTYSTHAQVRVGDTAVLPPLPWRRTIWQAEIVALGKGDYDGKILPAVNVEMKLRQD